MPDHTVRLADFAEITGRPRETIRNLTKAGALPWEDYKADGQQRRYTGEHALNMVIAEMLNMGGASLPEAGEAVRLQRKAVRAFLEAVEEGTDPGPRFVVVSWVFEERAALGGAVQKMTYARPSDGTAEDLQTHFGSVLSSLGHDWGGSRNIGGGLVIQSVNEAYRVLQARAEQNGFQVHGREIIKVDAD